MPRIVVSLTDGQKELWVAAAHDERVTLSEWVRRAADARAGVAGVGRERLAAVEAVDPFERLPSGPSRSFRPDPKVKK